MKTRSTIKTFRRSALLHCMFLGCVFTAAVSAHRLNYTATEIVWQPDGRTLDVTHSIHLDDAVGLLRHLGSSSGELDPQTTAQLLVYLDKNFSLATSNGALDLEPMGAHIDGDLLFVYRRSGAMSLPTQLNIHCQLLQELFDAPVNQVNWRVGDLVRSLQCDPTKSENELSLSK